MSREEKNIRSVSLPTINRECPPSFIPKNQWLAKDAISTGERGIRAFKKKQRVYP
ncbi:MAG: hypothetical protein LRY51_00605 [Geovibrio sp.]|nr:hypothetical protein [Geovibrio sp.]